MYILSLAFISPHLTPSHLLPQAFQDRLVLAVVSVVRSTILQSLRDFELQPVVRLFQVSHCLDITGQTFVQVLHGKLLIAHEFGIVAAHLNAASEAPRSRTYSLADPYPITEGRGRGEADSTPTCNPTVDSGCPVNRPSRSTHH